MTSINIERRISNCIDWVKFTFTWYNIKHKNAPTGSEESLKFIQDSFKLEKLKRILGFTKDEEITINKYPVSEGRDGQITLGENIKIKLNGGTTSTSDFYNTLDLSGQACREFESRGGSYYELFNFLISEGAKPTRIDGAIDCFTNEWFTIEKLLDYTKKGSVSCLMSKVSYNESFNLASETSEGMTLYYGSLKARSTLVCIYDKKLEQIQKGNHVEYEYWYRIEMRFYQERAGWFTSNFLKSIDGNNSMRFIPQALWRVLDFKELGYKNQNKSEIPTASWWKDFINSSSKAEFGTRKNEESISKKKRYLQRSLGKMLASIYYTDKDNFVKDILELISISGRKLENKDLLVINRYNRENNLPEFNKDDLEKMKHELKMLVQRLDSFEGVNDEED